MIFESTILKTEYLPPISTFWAINNAANTFLEINENYQKKSTRNRAKILGANGVEVLSIPLKKGKNSKMSINDVAISYESNWIGKHLHSVRSAYGNSPYFEYYFEPFSDILNVKYSSLLELNQRLFDFFVESIDINIDLKYTDSYTHIYKDNSLDLRNLKFDQSDIADYTPKTYNQVFEEKHGFIAGISILDLLMCKGPESILYI